MELSANYRTIFHPTLKLFFSMWKCNFCSSLNKWNKNVAFYLSGTYINVHVSQSSSRAIIVLRGEEKKKPRKENPGNATLEEILQSYCAFKNNLHQMAQGNKFKSALTWTVLWSKGMGLRKKKIKRKTLGTGCSEFIGKGNNWWRQTS